MDKGETIGFQRYPELKNQPIKIHMAGWTSDTYKLQNAGWQVSVEEQRDHANYSMRMRVALKHPQLKVYCITGHVHYDDGDKHWMMHYAKASLELHVVSIACDIQVIAVPDYFSNFRPVDARPVYEARDIMGHNYRSIEDFKIFRPLPPEKQIIVPQATVGELLSQIEKIQEPYQEILREEKRAAMRKFKREANESELVTNIVAEVATIG